MKTEDLKRLERAERRQRQKIKHWVEWAFGYRRSSWDCEAWTFEMVWTSGT